MTPNIQALRERYSPKPIPKCQVCGAEMTVQRMSASRITYGCTGATYDDAGCHYAEGRSIADDHYEQSRVTVVDVSDHDVLVLLDELEAKDKQIAEQREIMRQAASDIAYAIFNLTGSDLSRLRPGVVESTDPTDTALIAERNLRAAAGIKTKGE